MKKKIIILGAGGQALNVINLLLNEKSEYEAYGILVNSKIRGDILGVPILGDDSMLVQLKEEGITSAFPAVGFGVKVNNQLRKKVFEKLLNEGFSIPNLISSSALVRSGVKMGQGNLVQSGSIIDTDVELKNNISVGMNVCIGHSCVIEDHVTFAGGVTLNGGITIGEGSFLGMNCASYSNIGKWSKISPCTPCLEEVGDGMVAFGNPMRCIPNIQIDRI